MKYDLFVFAGQSNMMGACVLPPKHRLDIKYCKEYKYKSVYLGGKTGEFVTVGYNNGEFLYKNIKAAYGDADENGKSRVNDYGKNTYFVSAMSNLNSVSEKSTNQFSIYSESEKNSACSIVPYFCENWEQLGQAAIVAHVAKGGVTASYYFSKEMTEEYNLFAVKNGYEPIVGDEAAETVYCEKCKAFFKDAEKVYGHDNIGEKILIWHQGESDSGNSCAEYKQKLNIFWKKAKKLGFDRFFIIRCGFWYTHETCHIMRAQEEFCRENKETHIISRSISFMPDPYFMDSLEDYYIKEPEKKYFFCRDSYYGYDNSHINERGFMLAAKEAAQNAYRIMKENKEPDLKEDIVKYVTTHF